MDNFFQMTFTIINSTRYMVHSAAFNLFKCKNGTNATSKLCLLLDITFPTHTFPCAIVGKRNPLLNIAENILEIVRSFYLYNLLYTYIVTPNRGI